MCDTNHKGNVAEMVIATEAMKLGVHVMKPLGEHTRYDLVFDASARCTSAFSLPRTGKGRRYTGRRSTS